MIASAAMPLPKGIKEDAFGNVVNDLAGRRGWLRYHARPAQMKSGSWATPMQGDPGYQDLSYVNPLWRVGFVAELKTEDGRLRPGQMEWLEGWASIGVPAFLWRPRHWQATIVPILLGGVAPAFMTSPEEGRVVV